MFGLPCPPSKGLGATLPSHPWESCWYFCFCFAEKPEETPPFESHYEEELELPDYEDNTYEDSRYPTMPFPGKDKWNDNMFAVEILLPHIYIYLLHPRKSFTQGETFMPLVYLPAFTCWVSEALMDQLNKQNAWPNQGNWCIKWV